MAQTVEDLTEPVTDEQATANILDVASDLELPTEDWHEGGVVLTIIHIFARIVAAISIVITDIAKAGLLDLSSGAWLTLFAKSVYNVERILATFATGEVTLTNNGVGTITIDAGDIHLAHAMTGKTYAVEGPAVEGEDNLIGPGLSKKFVIVADEAGSASNANAGEITEFVTAVVDLDATNAKPVVGLDEESDSDLRQRCRDKLAALSPNGAAGAYAYFAKSAVRSDGTAIGVTRVRVDGDSSISQAIVYVATAAGVVTGLANDPDTDLGAINKVIQETVVPTGITTTVLSAAAHNITVVATLYMAKESTLTATEVKTAAVKRLTTYFATVPIGGFDIGGGPKVFRDAIIGQLYQTTSNVVDVSVTTPAADVTMAVNDVAINTTVNADITVVQLS